MAYHARLPIGEGLAATCFPAGLSPIQVRRVRDGYVLTDGLYRLRAAETLGLERIPAMVE